MDEVEDFLAHYGIKGMRWGKRKGGGSDAKKVAVPRAEGYTDRMQKNDRRRVGGDKGIEKVHQKVANGTSLKKARDEVAFERWTKNSRRVALAAVATMYVVPVLATYGGIALDQAVLAKKKSNGEKHARNMFADKNGIANYETIRLQQNPTTGNWV